MARLRSEIAVLKRGVQILSSRKGALESQVNTLTGGATTLAAEVRRLTEENERLRLALATARARAVAAALGGLGFGGDDDNSDDDETGDPDGSSGGSGGGGSSGFGGRWDGSVH